ncbi:tetratricopeptide repeat protein [Campylobacter sp. CCUG 57310]|uniref:tetratricopeptide repeat protein n=1 Tax=Campylobacter sp. CCUG 57310 TaxID=2517362 RepID=UPI0015678309|nr:tetratricopeptide repeat protein [Campylobacter sp. CCUG 57310]QKF91738.1 proximal disk protein PflB [Campylobacter sp. CCUG 57310]
MAGDNVVILEEADPKSPSDEQKGASQEENLISLDELQDSSEETPSEDISPKKSRKKLFLFGAIGILLVIALVTTLFFATRDKKPEFDPSQLARDIEDRFEVQKFGASKIDDMIQKANILYEKGNKFEALKIYENVAIYNESLSNYNLGVSQMKQEKFAEAIESFKKAINNKENIAVSAINAAVSSLELNNTKSFEYYIDLANSFLQEEAGSPLYNYYYALIRYYKGEYIEALRALSYPTERHYKNKYDYLSAKILTHLGEDEEAIQKLENQKEFDANLALGMLYARNAQYDKARSKLNLALKNSDEINKIDTILALIDIKTGNYALGADGLKTVFAKDKLFIENTFPIKAILKSELFDVNLAQMHFRNDIFFDKTRRYEVLFYFAPYKVFDASQTINYIRKGGVSLFLDDASSASSYLSASGTISKVNLELSKAIASALNYKLKDANAHFATLISLYPEHSILHYNLALSYAQLGNFSLAAKHFITSYHLDPTNHLAGVFGAIANDINNENNAKLLQEISENLEHDGKIKEVNLYKALTELVTGNQNALIRWLEEDKEQNALNLAFDAIIAKISNRNNEFIAKSEVLKSKLPDDVIANILNFIAKFDDQNIKEYVKQIQIHFHTKNLNEAAFYHGANIIKEQYIKLLQISGLLNYEREKLKNLILNGNKDDTNLLQTLAYIDIFTNDFKESYGIYNRLIDEFKINDAGTLFMAAVAAIGSNNPQNAIALLELSKLTDPNSSDSRLALAYLYQEVGNIEAAAIQYNLIKSDKFRSKFFDFRIDYDRLR